VKAVTYHMTLITHYPIDVTKSAAQSTSKSPNSQGHSKKTSSNNYRAAPCSDQHQTQLNVKKRNS
jgi:hypothetical protein